MKQTERHMKEILSRDIHISQTVEKRILDTYHLLGKRKARPKKNLGAAAAIAALCLVVPGVVYASSKTEFFQAMFGNSTKESHQAIPKEVDTGKGTTVNVILPSQEYVPVDEAKAEEAIGPWVSDTPIEKQIGSHTLRIESFAYDQNGGLMYFTLERKGGVTALFGDKDSNMAKGASFTEESDFYFTYETEQGIYGFDNIYIDTVKSTSDKMFCYSYLLWTEPLAADDLPHLVLNTYPCPIKEVTEETPVETEKIKLTDKAPIPMRIVDMGENGYLEYSPISLSVDMAKGFGLSLIEAQDPYYLTHLEIVYQDGSSYVVSDKENNVANSGYVLGSGTYYKTMFNRLTDVDAIQEIVVNDVRFSVN